jgi:protein TonB
MPRDLFDPSPVAQVTLAHRAGLVPISIAVHVVAIGTAVLIPALAVGALPDPRGSLTFVTQEVLLPAIPNGPAPPGTRPRVTPGAPTEAPSTLPPVDAEPAVAGTVAMDGPAIDGGLPFSGDAGFGTGIGTAIELPAPPPAPPRLLRVGGEVRAPVKIRDVRPVYPDIAQRARVQGIVIIEATIDGTGHVADARLLQSIPLLDDAALTAVRQWVFTPTRLNGNPISVLMTVTVQFKLQ